MELLFEIIKFIFYTAIIIAIAKYILVSLLRNFAESLNLKPKIIGNIAGIATSIPELLTISLASITGLAYTGIYNVISSNIINLILYIVSTIYNKNIKILRNQAIKIDLVLVIFTIFIPIFIINMNLEKDLSIIPIFILLFILFYFINHRTHNYYLKNYEKVIENNILEEEKYKKNKTNLIIKYSIYIIIVGILLFFVGNLLSNTLENLCNKFNIKESFIGIILGFATSIPELITFFESQKYNKNSNNDLLGVVESTNNLLTSNILNLFIIQNIVINRNLYEYTIYRNYWR